MSDFKRPSLDTLLLTYGLVSLGGGIPWNILANAGITLDEIKNALQGSLDVPEEVFRYNNVAVADSVEVAFKNATGPCTSIQTHLHRHRAHIPRAAR